MKRGVDSGRSCTSNSLCNRTHDSTYPQPASSDASSCLTSTTALNYVYLTWPLRMSAQMTLPCIKRRISSASLAYMIRVQSGRRQLVPGLSSDRSHVATGKHQYHDPMSLIDRARRSRVGHAIEHCLRPRVKFRRLRQEIMRR